LPFEGATSVLVLACRRKWLCAYVAPRNYIELMRSVPGAVRLARPFGRFPVIASVAIATAR